MISKLSAIGAAVLAIAAFAAPASAATVGYSLTVANGALGGTLDAPSFKLTNQSDPGISIVSINYTIGDTNFNFDQMVSFVAPAGGSMSLTTGDALSGGVRTDAFSFAFTGFDAGEFASWRAEIDPDSFNANRDFRTVFFNNGGPSVPNSLVTVLFSDSTELELTLAATGGGNSYTFSASRDTLSAVPIPATLPLLAGAFGLLGIARLRRSGAAA